MAYQIKQLAKLSGVSIRTLHFYDEIGLLKPAYYGDNNYRYYKEEQVLLLQQILFFRELGFSLQDIKTIMSAADFDKIKTLESHRQILLHNIEQTQEIIATINKTITHLKGKSIMKHEELFYGLNSERQKNYEKYLVDNKIVTQEFMQECNKQMQGVTDDQLKTMLAKGEVISDELVLAIQKNLKTNDPHVQELIQQHFDWLKQFWLPTRESYIGLGHLYCEHPDFRKYYENFHPRLADYLAEAMKIFAEKNLV